MNFVDKMTELLKVSSDLLGKETVIKPIISRSILSVLNHILFMISLTGIGYDFYRKECFILLLIQILLIIPYSIYFHMKIKTIQARTTSSLLTEPSPLSFQDAKIEASSNKAVIFSLAWLFFLINRYITNLKDSNKFEGRENPSFLNKVSSVFLSSISMIIDVAENFLIPAVIVEKQGVIHGIKKLKELKSSYAELLTSGAGFQLLNSALMPFVSILQIILLLLGIAIGCALSQVLPESLLNDVPDFLTSFMTAKICYLPVILFSFMGAIVSAIFSISLESLEVVYYTTFYMTTSNRESIRPEILKDMDSFMSLAKNN